MKLGSVVSNNSTIIVFAKDYQEYVTDKYPGVLTNKFLDVVKRSSGYFYTTEDLKEFSSNEIKQLIQHGLLAVGRDVGKWLLSLPGAGVFLKVRDKGRDILLKTIRSTKFREIASTELQHRSQVKLPNECKIHYRYYLSDLIGSGDVESVSTPTGLLLRLK